MYTNGLRHFASSGFAKWLLTKDRERRRRDIINVKKKNESTRKGKNGGLKINGSIKQANILQGKKYKGKIEREEEQDENAEMKERKKKT